MAWWLKSHSKYDFGTNSISNSVHSWTSHNLLPETYPFSKLTEDVSTHLRVNISNANGR